MKTRVTDTDRGFQRLLKDTKAASKGAGVSVGIHAAEGSASEGNGVTILDVAMWNEFGLGVPERSFLRAWVDENAGPNAEALRRAMVLVLKGQKTLPEALELIGLKFVGGMQQRISAGILPENAPSTIAKKGSSKPLIDSGAMRQAITYLVRGKSSP